MSCPGAFVGAIPCEATTTGIKLGPVIPAEIRQPRACIPFITNRFLEPNLGHLSTILSREFGLVRVRIAELGTYFGTRFAEPLMGPRHPSVSRNPPQEEHTGSLSLQPGRKRPARPCRIEQRSRPLRFPREP